MAAFPLPTRASWQVGAPPGHLKPIAVESSADTVLPGVLRLLLLKRPPSRLESSCHGLRTGRRWPDSCSTAQTGQMEVPPAQCQPHLGISPSTSSSPPSLPHPGKSQLCQAWSRWWPDSRSVGFGVSACLCQQLWLHHPGDPNPSPALMGAQA